MEDADELAIKREMAIMAVKECEDLDTLNLVYKLLIFYSR